MTGISTRRPDVFGCQPLFLDGEKPPLGLALKIRGWVRLVACKKNAPTLFPDAGAWSAWSATVSNSTCANGSGNVSGRRNHPQV